MKWKNMGTKGKALLIVIAALLAITGVWFGRRAYATHQVAQRADHALADAGYTRRTVRRRVYKEATGPLSGISWYNYTFADAATLKASRAYATHQGKDPAKLTLANCPIVYRVVLTPPGTKDGRWDAVIYLDTNAALRDSDRSAYVQRLNQRSRRTLKLRTQDLR